MEGGVPGNDRNGSTQRCTSALIRGLLFFLVSLSLSLYFGRITCHSFHCLFILFRASIVSSSRIVSSCVVSSHLLAFHLFSFDFISCRVVSFRRSLFLFSVHFLHPSLCMHVVPRFFQLICLFIDLFIIAVLCFSFRS
jgi:hypothetical protein